MRELWAQECQLRAVGASPKSGIEAVLAYFRRIFSLWAEHRDEPTRVIVAGDTVTAEVRFVGITPAGKQVEFNAVDVIDIEAGKVKVLTNWYDIAYAREQLAVSPGLTTHPRVR